MVAVPGAASRVVVGADRVAFRPRILCSVLVVVLFAILPLPIWPQRPSSPAVAPRGTNRAEACFFMQ